MTTKLSELKVGDIVNVFGHDCMNGQRVVLNNAGELYVKCDKGHHYLKGQIGDDSTTLIGISKAKNKADKSANE